MPEVRLVHPHDFTVVEILKATRDRVEQGWCQNSGARTRTGRRCPPTDPEATRFCISGALQRSLAEREPELGDAPAARPGEYCVLVNYLAQLTSQQDPRYWSVISWNDRAGRRRSEVVALLELAITCLK